MASVHGEGELYGVQPLTQPSGRTGRVWQDIREIGPGTEERSVLVRGRIQSTRNKGKIVFLVIRARRWTIQGVVAADETKESQDMVDFVSGLPRESIVDVTGTVKRVGREVVSCTCKSHEILVNKIHVVSLVEHRIPFSVEEASAPEKDGVLHVNLDTRLDNRMMDLRVPRNQMVFEISTSMVSIMRVFLEDRGFKEIHTPKLISCSSEGGAGVFKVGYFDHDAFLAQSPQLYKQMAICSDFWRVFEIGPIFRKEKSFTHRHMTEFTGFDVEMEIMEHYHEVFDVLGRMFVHLFDELKRQFSNEIVEIWKHYEVEEIAYPADPLVLKYTEAVEMLNMSGEQVGALDDLSLAQEQQLGRLVKKKYGTDFYILDKFPLEVKPFYVMPDPEDLRYSNSYDFFLRGEEILSGAQRIHDYKMLVTSIHQRGIDEASIRGYLESFKYGAPPHAGAGIGLERLVMLFLGLGNIRRAAMYPRDPKRLYP